MKAFSIMLSALVWLGSSAFHAHAQGKIGTIDLRQVFEKYHKTIAGSALIREEAADLKKELESMVEQFRKDELDYRSLLDRSTDQALSSEERERSKRAAEQKLIGLREREQDIHRQERSAETRLAESNRRRRDRILQEIREVINARAKAAGYVLVLDTSAESLANTPVVIFSTGENDLTQEVLQILNPSSPAGTLKPGDPRRP